MVGRARICTGLILLLAGCMLIAPSSRATPVTASSLASSAGSFQSTGSTEQHVDQRHGLHEGANPSMDVSHHGNAEGASEITNEMPNDTSQQGGAASEAALHAHGDRLADEPMHYHGAWHVTWDAVKHAAAKLAALQATYTAHNSLLLQSQQMDTAAADSNQHHPNKAKHPDQTKSGDADSLLAESQASNGAYQYFEQQLGQQWQAHEGPGPGQMQQQSPKHTAMVDASMAARRKLGSNRYFYCLSASSDSCAPCDNYNWVQDVVGGLPEYACQVSPGW